LGQIRCKPPDRCAPGHIIRSICPRVIAQAPFHRLQPPVLWRFCGNFIGPLVRLNVDVPVYGIEPRSCGCVKRLCISPRAGAKPQPFLPPHATFYNFKYNLPRFHNKKRYGGGRLAQLRRSTTTREVKCSIPGDNHILKNHKPMMGCHLAALDWATWHPYQPIKTCHMSTCYSPTSAATSSLPY
jgi:hypothetical protein